MTFAAFAASTAGDPAVPNAVVLRYDEIAIKGRNRSYFERRLVRNVKRILGNEFAPVFIRERGRILLCMPEGAPLPDGLLDVLRNRANRIFGLSSASPVVAIPPTMDALDATVSAVFPRLYARCRQAHPSSEAIPYAMRVKRQGKAFPMRSKAIEIRFAERFLANYPDLQVNLTCPDLLIEVEIRDTVAFVCWERIPGPGGLPVGGSGTVLALLSGGIDSPVACQRMMKRGNRVHFVTFHSSPYTPDETVETVAELARVLNRYQPAGRLFALNLLPFQKAVRDIAHEKYRTLLYRRMMVRMSCLVAERMHAGALLTGDALGQVASQTLRNLNVVDAVADRLILRPLLGFDKKETTEIARAMGTLELSCRDVPDSCTVFAPASPATGARVDEVAHEERRLERMLDEREKAQDCLTSCVAECLRQSFEVDLATNEKRPLLEALPPPPSTSHPPPRDLPDPLARLLMALLDAREG